MKTITSTIYLAFALLAFACCAFLPTAQAVVPAPDGGYPGGNTAEGQNALFSLNGGGFNTAVGYLSLRNNSTNSFNTAMGAGTLFANTADQNTAIGAGALLSNTVGNYNTANGAFALFSSGNGNYNTAVGNSALLHAAFSDNNTAIGALTLENSTMSTGNTAVGTSALLGITTGNFNIGLGDEGGIGVTTASHVICIGTVGENVDNSCYIGNIFGATSSSGTAVLINSNGKLGTMTSSRRFKEGIKPMDKASESILALKPVTFRYKKEIDAAGTSQFGLVAEEVEKVNRDLVVRDKEGKPYSVRYDQVNAMLLNEFLKEHRTVQELKSNAAKQDATIAQQQKQIEALTAGLQKVSAQLEASKPAPQMVFNRQ
jgi:Chaperone of endosialidase